MNVIQTKGLCKAYGAKNAVDNLDLVVPEGAIYGFIGRNGAGKSTTQKMVCGLANPTSGEIKLFGKDVSNPDARRNIGVLIENAGLYPAMTAQENLRLYALCIGLPNVEKKINECLQLVGLTDTGKKKVKHFSMGMKQRLGIALAMLGDPKLLILDEPINGLDPEGIREFRQMMVMLNRERGMTIFISSHILGELSKMATHYGIIKNGKMVQQISAVELSRLCQDYLKVKVKDAGKAGALLAQKIAGLKFEVCDGDELRLYEVTDTDTVAEALAANGFVIREIYLHKVDLEEYFLDFMGGADNA